MFNFFLKKKLLLLNYNMKESICIFQTDKIKKFHFYKTKIRAYKV